jgi:putative transposase
MCFYISVNDYTFVEQKLLELAAKRLTRGFGHYLGIIRNEGVNWNHKRVKRVYNKLGLNKRSKVKNRVSTRV